MQENFDIQGHRGCRGYYPENTIQGFIKAIDLGVTTLEMDAVITKDKQVVLSHEPFMSHTICLDPSGKEIREYEERAYNIYQMHYSEVLQFDCGSKDHKHFPEQIKAVADKPLLMDVITAVEQYIQLNALDPVHYNIETKCAPTTDGIFHPGPEEFVDLLMEVVISQGIAEKVIIQSFDFRTLKYTRSQYPSIPVSVLVAKEKDPDELIERLGYVPDVYSPYFELVSLYMVNYCRAEQMKLIPWTVNNPEQIRKMIQLGVDGIISDYPDLVLAELNS